jgi:ferredoxin
MTELNTVYHNYKEEYMKHNHSKTTLRQFLRDLIQCHVCVQAGRQFPHIQPETCTWCNLCAPVFK